MSNKGYIHPAVPFLLLYSYATDQFIDAIVLCSLLVGHEGCHALVARFFGWRMERWVFHPFGFSLTLHQPRRYVAWHEAVILIAGPVFHLIVATVLLVVDAPKVAQWNHFLFVVNMLPIWPLDGGRCLLLIVQHYYPYREALKLTWRLAEVQLVLVVLLMSVVSFTSFYLWIVLIVSGWTLWQARRNEPYTHQLFLWQKYAGPTGSIIRRTGKPTLAALYRTKRSVWYDEGELVDEHALLARHFTRTKGEDNEAIIRRDVADRMARSLL